MTDNIRRRAIVIIVCIALTLAFIWGHSLVPRPYSARESSIVLEAIAYVAQEVFNVQIDTSNDHAVRKLAHFAEFGLLGAELTMLYFVFGIMNGSSAACIMLAGLTAACVDEYLQTLSDRGSMLSDVFLDYAGVITGMLLVLFFHEMRRRRDHFV